MHGMWAQSTPVTLNGTTREYGVVHNMAVVVAARQCVRHHTSVCGQGRGLSVLFSLPLRHTSLFVVVGNQLHKHSSRINKHSLHG
jgi:hypothetical protein